jgi:hypothetical protein
MSEKEVTELRIDKIDKIEEHADQGSS